MKFKALKFNRSANLLLVAIFIYGIVYNIWGLFLNLFVLSNHFNKEFLGIANMVPAIAALVLGIPLGVLSDKIGRKRAMLIGLAGSAFSTGLMAISNTAGMILLSSFLWGIGTTLFTISQAPFLMKISDENNRLTLFSLNSSLQIVAGVFGNYFAGQIPGFAAGWLHISEVSPAAYQIVFFTSTAVGILAIIPLLFIHKEQPVTSPLTIKPVDALVESPSDFNLKWLIDPAVIKLVLPNTIIGAGAGILIPYLNIFYMERFGLGNRELGLLFSISALITGVGIMSGPRLAGWLGSKVKVVVITQATSLFFMMLSGFSQVMGLSIVGFLMRGMLINIAPPVWSAFCMEQTSPSRQGAVNSFMNLTWTAGWLLGPYISGIIQERYGFSPLFIATFFLYGLAILLTWIFFRNSEPRKVSAGAGYLRTAVEENE
jgi:MFS family permease